MITMTGDLQPAHMGRLAQALDAMIDADQCKSSLRSTSERSANFKREKTKFMTDLIWLAVLGGLFLLTLVYVRLCDEP